MAQSPMPKTSRSTPGQRWRDRPATTTNADWTRLVKSEVLKLQRRGIKVRKSLLDWAQGEQS